MADENSVNLPQNTYRVRFITRFYLFKAVMSERNRNKLPTNLPQLQNLVKRDPDSYGEEVSEIVFTVCLPTHVRWRCCSMHLPVLPCFALGDKDIPLFYFLVSLNVEESLCNQIADFVYLLYCVYQFNTNQSIPSEAAANAVIHVLNSCHPVAIV